MIEKKENYLTIKLLRDWVHLQELENRYNVPAEDILLIALNASGVRWNKIDNDRIRFPLHILGTSRKYFLALTVTNSPLSNFFIEEDHENRWLFFGDKLVGEIPRIEFDTCTDSYWRKGKSHLTLNTNSRSKCEGCKFCGTYRLVGEDAPLTDEYTLTKKAEAFCRELGNLKLLKSLGIVTACFPSEEKVVDHILMVRRVFSRYGFKGEISYIGSQLRNIESLRKIIASGPFSYYLTVEMFTRRENLMKRVKSSLSLEEGRTILEKAISLGANTSYLYIVGLDPLEVMEGELPKYRDVITRFPNAQIFQVYIPEQIYLRDLEAFNIEYFLKARLIFENAYPGLDPDRYLNYRSLWYSSYREKELAELDLIT